MCTFGARLYGGDRVLLQEFLAFLLGCQLRQLATFLLINRREEVLNDIVLPVVDLAISLHLRLCVLNVVDVEPCVISEISEGHLIKFLCKQHRASS